MKLIVNQKNFQKGLGVAERVVTKNSSLPILNNILLKTENGRLRISATNLEIGTTCFIGSKIEEPGEITVPARVVSEFVAGVSDEKIVLNTKQNVLNITSERYKTQILGADPKDFPIIPKIKSPSFCRISAEDIKDLLSSVIDSVALSDTRPELAGIFLNFKKDKVTCASTDSFRLSEKIKNSKSTEDKSLIIPKNTALEIIRLAGDVVGDVEIKTSENQISFASEDFEIVSRLVDGNYPDYQRVIPEKFISQALIKKEELEKNIKLAGIFSSRISDVKISVKSGEYVVTAKNSEKGEVEAKGSAVLKSDSFETSLNYHYLLDGLKHVETDQVLIEFIGQGSPLVIKPATANKSFTYVIMPLRQS